jgi:hypothetical protein
MVDEAAPCLVLAAAPQIGSVACSSTAVDAEEPISELAAGRVSAPPAEPQSRVQALGPPTEGSLCSQVPYSLKNNARRIWEHRFLEIGIVVSSWRNPVLLMALVVYAG